jgi:hypothetical protein
MSLGLCLSGEGHGEFFIMSTGSNAPNGLRAFETWTKCMQTVSFNQFSCVVILLTRSSNSGLSLMTLRTAYPSHSIRLKQTASTSSRQVQTVQSYDKGYSSWQRSHRSELVHCQKGPTRMQPHKGSSKQSASALLDASARKHEYSCSASAYPCHSLRLLAWE